MVLQRCPLEGGHRARLKSKLRGGALREFRVRLDLNRRRDLRPRRGARQGRYPKAREEGVPTAPLRVWSHAAVALREDPMGLPSSRGWDRSTRRPSACPRAEARSRQTRRGARVLANRRCHRTAGEGLRKQQCCPPCDLLIFTNPSSDSCGKESAKASTGGCPGRSDRCRATDLTSCRCPITPSVNRAEGVSLRAGVNYSARTRAGRSAMSSNTTDSPIDSDSSLVTPRRNRTPPFRRQSGVDSRDAVLYDGTPPW